MAGAIDQMGADGAIDSSRCRASVAERHDTSATATGDKPRAGWPTSRAPGGARATSNLVSSVHDGIYGDRGLLYHRYEIDDEGAILNTRIVLPTSGGEALGGPRLS